MEKKPIFIKNIQEAEKILGLSLSLIKKLGRERFLNHYGKGASTVVLIPQKSYERITKKPFAECLEWLNKATCSEDAFSIIYNAMQTICDHLGWERRA